MEVAMRKREIKKLFMVVRNLWDIFLSKRNVLYRLELRGVFIVNYVQSIFFRKLECLHWILTDVCFRPSQKCWFFPWTAASQGLENKKRAFPLIEPS